MTKTYNGYEILSRLSGLSQAELRWTAARLAQLLRHDKLPRTEALAIVREEQKSKPWLTVEQQKAPER